MNELIIAKFVAPIVLVPLLLLVYFPLQKRRQAQARTEVRAWLLEQGHNSAEVSFGDSERGQWRFQITTSSIAKGRAVMQKRDRSISLILSE